MQRPLRNILLFGLLISALLSTSHAKPMWQNLVPRKNVAADPQGDYSLTDAQGPWLIMAMYFSGEEGESLARKLVLDLRQNHDIAAFHWGMSFQLDEANPGRGLDDYGGKTRHRYARGTQVTQHAVLVGNFPSLGDPEAQDLLKKIKTLAPAALGPDSEGQTAESLTNVGKFRNYLRKNNGTNQKAGPMRQAFVTRNPLLPKEYFAPIGISKGVAKWNSGQEFSLLKCPNKYTIKVATFKGRSTLVKSNQGLPADKKIRKPKESDSLVVAVDNAHLLTMALREKGWEAYEFHDRFESYVSVGSFNEGRQAANGSVQLDHRDAQIIIDTFGASTPNNIFNRPAAQDLHLEQQRKQQFTTLLGNQGQVVNGFHPKKFVGLPFDIYPKPIAVPRLSISSAYVRN